MPLCFLTYDFVGHCEEVASECAMQHDVVTYGVLSLSLYMHTALVTLQVFST